MFEKEAEEYAEKVYRLEGSLCINIQEQACAIGFRAGGEYVYNKLKNENDELKCFIRDLIYENHNLCFQFNNTTCLFNSDYRNRAEELMGEKL